MASDLVGRLRHRSQNTCDEYLHELTGRAADRITELEAEVERAGGNGWRHLQRVIDQTAQHWLDFQRENVLPWEGGIDAAMKAACDRITQQDAVIAGLVEALERIGSLADRCGILPDTDGLRRAYRDIDVMSRVALAKAKESRDD